MPRPALCLTAFHPAPPNPGDRHAHHPQFTGGKTGGPARGTLRLEPGQLETRLSCGCASVSLSSTPRLSLVYCPILPPPLLLLPRHCFLSTLTRPGGEGPSSSNLPRPPVVGGRWHNVGTHTLPPPSTPRAPPSPIPQAFSMSVCSEKQSRASASHQTWFARLSPRAHTTTSTTREAP